MGGYLSLYVTEDPKAIAEGIFASPGVSVVDASWIKHAAESAATFGDGPFGIGDGGMLTTGFAIGALEWLGWNDIVDDAGSSPVYCGPNSFDAAVLSVDITVEPGYHGVEMQFILASEEFT